MSTPLLDRFRSLTAPRQMALVVGLAALLTIVLVAGYLVLGRTAYATAFADLRPKAAATIVDELERKKIPYRVTDDGTKIMVPANLAASTRLDVTTEDLPLRGTVGFELFNKSDMGLTEFAQKINYQRALQGELERTIMALDPIETARVHLAMSEQTLFREDKVPPKASVTVTTRSGVQLTSATVNGIARVVAASVPELDPANVVVLDGSGHVLNGDDQVAAPASPFLQQKLAIEQYYVGKIRQALEQNYPGGGVTVQVWAGMRPDDGAAGRAIASGTPTDTVGAGGAPDHAELTTRNYPLRILLSSTMPLSVQAQQEVRTIVTSAAALDPAKGDSVELGMHAAPVAGAAGSSFSAPAMPFSDRQFSAPSAAALSWPLIAVLAITALAIGSAALGSALRQRRRRTDYVARLRVLLDRESFGATPHA